MDDFIFRTPPRPEDYNLTEKIHFACSFALFIEKIAAYHALFINKFFKWSLIITVCMLPLCFFYKTYMFVAFSALPFLCVLGVEMQLGVFYALLIDPIIFLLKKTRYGKYVNEYIGWKQNYLKSYEEYQERCREKREREKLEYEQEQQRKRELEEQERQRKKFKLKQYWVDNTGYEFERKIEELFSYHKFVTKLTPASNDGGVDVIAHKDGHTIAIQCKCHKNPTGIKDARELYGVLCDRRDEFTGGILVNPAGFTAGVYEFVKNKPIRLFDIEHLLYWSQVRPE